MHLVYVNVKGGTKKFAHATYAIMRTDAAQRLKSPYRRRWRRLGALSSNRPTSRGTGWPAFTVQIGRLARKRGVDPEEFTEPFFQVRLLAFQQLDLLQALLTAERQRIGVGVPFFGGDHLTNFTKRETQLLALQDQGKTRPIAQRVKPAQPLALRRKKPLVLVEA